jgi:DNA-directed RNA polymerase subunit RPC12/RpoP
MKEDRLVTILTFVYPHESGIPRSLLESEGIECFMRDEMTATVQPFYSNAIGGIKLQVRESDVQKAIEVLTEGGFINEAEKKALMGEEEAVTKVSDGSTCPHCGSTEIVRKKSAFAAMLSMLLLGFPVPPFRKGNHCMDCGKNFKKRGNADS